MILNKFVAKKVTFGNRNKEEEEVHIFTDLIFVF